jgi:hypothetical protein
MTTEAAAFADYISGAAQAAEEPVPEPIWVFKEGDTFTLHNFTYVVLKVDRETILAGTVDQYDSGLPIKWVLKHATNFAHRPSVLDEVIDTVSV